VNFCKRKVKKLLLFWKGEGKRESELTNMSNNFSNCLYAKKYISEREWLCDFVRATTSTRSEAKSGGEKVRGKNGKGKESGGLGSAIRLHR
jgi:hypothetical protein